MQSNVGMMKPWIGRRYHFEPKPDLSAFELAEVLKAIEAQTGELKLTKPLQFPNGVPSELARHFRMEEH